MRFRTEKYFKVAAFCVITMEIPSSIDFDWAGCFFPWNYSFCGKNIRNNVQKMMLIEYVSSNSVAYEKVQTNRKLFRWCGSCYRSPVLEKKTVKLNCSVSFHSVLLNLCVLFIFICNFLAQELMRIMSFQMRDKLFVNGKKVGCYYPSVN